MSLGRLAGSLSSLPVVNLYFKVSCFNLIFFFEIAVLLHNMYYLNILNYLPMKTESHNSLPSSFQEKNGIPKRCTVVFFILSYC